MRVSHILAVAALLLAGPLSAQSPDPVPPQAEGELECAMWAAMVGGSVEEPELKNAFGFALSYWVGRFEGMTGRDFNAVATREFVESLQPRAEELRQRCAPQMQEIGERMAEWGQQMQESPEAP